MNSWKQLYLKLCSDTNFEKYINNNIPPINSTFPKNYNDIFNYLGIIILYLIPFITQNTLHTLLIGICVDNIDHRGYLGKGIYDKNKHIINNRYLNPTQETAEINKYNSKLLIIYNYIHTNIIQSIILDLKHLCNLDITNNTNKYYQAEIDRQFGFNNLNNKSWITYEIIKRLECQGILNSYKKSRKKYIKYNNSNYIVPLYIKPNLSKSKYHTLIVYTLNTLICHNNNYTIIQEYKFVNGVYSDTNKHFLYDIALLYNDTLLFLIEVDGEQHFKFTKKFHLNSDGFDKEKKNDAIKNRFIINNNYKLLRFHFKDINNNISDNSIIIQDMIDNYKTKDHITFTKSY